MENYTKEPLTSANRRTALRHYDAYQRSTSYELYDVYGRCSSAKMKAWDYCKELMYKFNGYGLKIISANGYQFTAGFMFEEDGKEMFMYISKSHDIAVEVA
jgi:hypothetical protein